MTASNQLNLQKKEFNRATAWYWKTKYGFDRPLFVADKILKNHHLVYSQSQLAKLEPIPQDMFLNNKLGNTTFLNSVMQNCNDNIMNNLLPLISNNPDVKFDFVFTASPTLRVQSRKLYQRNKYIASLLILKKFTESLSNHSNVRVFAFGLENFTDDLRLYKDSGHYHIDVNNFIIESIAHNKNILTKHNIDEYLVLFDKKVSDYRLSRKWNPKYTDKISSKGSKLSMEEARRLIEN